MIFKNEKTVCVKNIVLNAIFTMRNFQFTKDSMDKKKPLVRSRAIFYYIYII